MEETQETWVQSLSQEEDSLEEDMATHSSILAWKIPLTEEPGGLQSMGVAKSWTSTHGGPVVRTLCFYCSGPGSGN